MKVYLAGPEVFLPNAIAIGLSKKEICSKYGFQGQYPFDNELSPDQSGTRLDRLIYRANAAMICQVDFGVINLTPFRGPSADVGTVFEMGMLIGLGKPVFAYSNSSKDYLSRLIEIESANHDEETH